MTTSPVQLIVFKQIQLYTCFNFKGANHTAAVVNSVDAKAICGKADAVCLFVWLLCFFLLLMMMMAMVATVAGCLLRRLTFMLDGQTCSCTICTIRWVEPIASLFIDSNHLIRMLMVGIMMMLVAEETLRSEKKTILLFWACTIILGPPKHVLHLVWSAFVIYTAIHDICHFFSTDNILAVICLHTESA